jgi:hypothetical protein
MEVAHHNRALRKRLVDDDSFADKARPQYADRKRDSRESLSRNLCDWHCAFPPGVA